MTKIYTGSSVQRKRLQRFIKFLMKLPTESFNLAVVCQAKKSLEPSEVKIGSCGTVACAIGHLPNFNPNRFSFTCNYSDSKLFNVKDNITKDEMYSEHAMKYFGLTQTQTREIFTPYVKSYKINGRKVSNTKITPQMVAQRLQNVLDNEPYQDLFKVQK